MSGARLPSDDLGSQNLSLSAISHESSRTESPAFDVEALAFGDGVARAAGRPPWSDPAKRGALHRKATGDGHSQIDAPHHEPHCTTECGHGHQRSPAAKSGLRRHGLDPVFCETSIKTILESRSGAH